MLINKILIEMKLYSLHRNSLKDKLYFLITHDSVYLGGISMKGKLYI